MPHYTNRFVMFDKEEVGFFMLVWMDCSIFVGIFQFLQGALASALIYFHHGEDNAKRKAYFPVWRTEENCWSWLGFAKRHSSLLSSLDNLCIFPRVAFLLLLPFMWEVCKKAIVKDTHKQGCRHTGAAATNNSISKTWATNERRGNARAKGPHSQQLAQAVFFLLAWDLH